MTLEQIKTEILSRAKTNCISDSMQAVILATTHSQLIEAGRELIEWAFQTGVIDTDLLQEFTDSDLNAAGIYYKGSATISNPAMEIFAIGDAVLTVNVNTSIQVPITFLGSGRATINLSNNAYAKISGNDKSQINLFMSNNSVANIEARDQCAITAELNNYTMMQLDVRGYSTTDLTLKNNSTCLGILQQKSNVVYNLQNDAKFYLQSKNKYSSLINSTMV